MAELDERLDGSEHPAENAKSDLGDFLLDLVAMRSAFDTHLPIRNSLIAWDILTEILLSHYDDRPLQVKVLLSQLPHSRTGIDYHYRWLIDEGWIEIYPCCKDRRVRYARPSERLLSQVRVMVEGLEGRLHQFGH